MTVDAGVKVDKELIFFFILTWDKIDYTSFLNLFSWVDEIDTRSVMSQTREWFGWDGGNEIQEGNRHSSGHK